MKKELLIVILLFDLLSTGYSQDKIITKNNDSGTTIQEVQKGRSTESYERLRLGISGGLGYITGSTKVAEENMVNLGFLPDKVQSYYKGMRSGRYANVDLTYQIAPRYGVGIKYKFFNTSGSIEGFVDPHDGMNLIYSTYGEHIYVNFLGTAFIFQQFIGSSKSFKINASGSIGLTTYRNEAEYLSGYYLITGKNAGMDLSLEFEYFISRFLSVGAELSSFYSTIRKVKVTDGTSTTTLDLEKGKYEDLSRLEISAGIRLYLWEK